MKNNSLYWIVAAVTTLAVALSLSTLATVILIQPKKQEVSSMYPGLSAGSSRPAGGFSVTPTAAQQLSPSETWVLKGIAIGKSAGNETGDPFMAEVIRLSDGRYRMYYGWAGGQMSTGIKSAISSDGKTWTAEMGFRLQGSSTASDRERVVSGPSIVKLPDGRYRMYYQSSPQIEQGKAPGFHVRSAISSDGLTFIREGIRIDIAPYTTTTGLSLAGHGTYFQARDGTYVGIFSGNLGSSSKPSDLVMATSKDGLTWGNFKALYQKWHDPIVLATNSGYVIYATYLIEKQGKAVSTDGLTWPSQMTDITMQDSTGKRLTEGNSGVGDIGGVVLPDGSIRLYVNYGSQQKSDSVAYLEKQ